MYNVRTLVDSAKIEDQIFNACRANEKREARGNVTFRLLANGDHEAVLRDADGVVIALAVVDKHDC